MPPSPAVMFLLAWKLNVPISPIAPTGCPFHDDPQAWQASSRTGIPCFLATSSTPSISAGWPPMCTGTIALVRSVIARSEEHTSELQSREKLVCRLLLEKKKIGRAHV